VNRYMVGFVALDQILGRFSRSVVDEFHDLCVRSKLLDDDFADPASLGIPPDVVTNLECFRHRDFLLWLSLSEPRYWRIKNARTNERGLSLRQAQPYPLSFRRSHALTVFVGSTASISTCIATTFPFVSIR